MLLCDKCDSECHTYCQYPIVWTIPDGEWFCPNCREVRREGGRERERGREGEREGGRGRERKGEGGREGGGEGGREGKREPIKATRCFVVLINYLCTCIDSFLYDNEMFQKLCFVCHFLS